MLSRLLPSQSSTSPTRVDMMHPCRQEKRERVVGVINALGLDKCKNTLVGGPMRRGVSGGERKRVSVGHELLISPSIIILDEPTSGLDSTTAMSLIQTLRALARDGRTIITTIHQPSSRLFQQLDRLMLMSSGHVMYSGLGSEVGAWFELLGCKLPYGWNIADFILDLANGEFQDGARVLGVMAKDRKGKLIEVRSKPA
jgi:energy-coupling factor transporter ATP-binding protein EcfA2